MHTVKRLESQSRSFRRVRSVCQIKAFVGGRRAGLLEATDCSLIPGLFVVRPWRRSISAAAAAAAEFVSKRRLTSLSLSLSLCVCRRAPLGTRENLIYSAHDARAVGVIARALLNFQRDSATPRQLNRQTGPARHGDDCVTMRTSPLSCPRDDLCTPDAGRVVAVYCILQPVLGQWTGRQLGQKR